MAIVSRTVLKSYFETDDIPTQAQFIDLIDTLLEDNSGARIKTAYEGEAETNALTDTKNTDLNNTTNTNSGDNAANTSSVAKSLFDAQTILQATSDNTPVAITIAEQRLLGRITAGNITDLTDAQIRTLLGLATTDSPQFENVVAEGPGGGGTETVISAFNLDDGAGNPGAKIELVSSGFGEWSIRASDSKKVEAAESYLQLIGAPNGIRFRKRTIARTTFEVSDDGDAIIGNSTDGSSLTMNERSADPSDPAEGQNVTWQSDGTASGDDGDIMMKITAGATTKTITLVDFSTF